MEKGIVKNTVKMWHFVTSVVPKNEGWWRINFYSRTGKGVIGTSI